MGHLSDDWRDAINGDYVNQDNNPIESFAYPKRLWQDLSLDQKFAMCTIILGMLLLVFGNCLK